MSTEEARLLAPLTAVAAHRARVLAAALAVLLVGWLSSGITTVGPDEVGIVGWATALFLWLTRWAYESSNINARTTNLSM